MNCPKCKTELRRVKVNVYGANEKVISLQCPKCDYFEFEKHSSNKVIKELKQNPTNLINAV